MSLFSAILEKLGFSKREEPSKPAAAPAPGSAAQGAPVATPAVVALSAVDVVAKLEGLAASNPQKLNWKVSIVDLLKLLSLDSSLEARKGLATELAPLPRAGVFPAGRAIEIGLVAQVVVVKDGNNEEVGVQITRLSGRGGHGRCFVHRLHLRSVVLVEADSGALESKEPAQGTNPD